MMDRLQLAVAKPAAVRQSQAQGECEPDGVRSVLRAFQLLEVMANSGGQMSIAGLAKATGISAPSVHRLLQTLVAASYVRKLPSRQYALGPRLLTIGDRAHDTFNAWAGPALDAVVKRTGVTANLAMLESCRAVYVAQASSRCSTRPFAEVGQRVSLHSTGVGKALLSQLDAAEVRKIVGRTGLPAYTSRTVSSLDGLLAELDRIRRRGFAIDDGEQEVGVRCVAISLRGRSPRLAMSVSGPAPQLALSLADAIARTLLNTAEQLEAAYPRDRQSRL
jgi:IclR family transcriptional regulator, acetate operon repressor